MANKGRDKKWNLLGISKLYSLAYVFITVLSLVTLFHM